MAGGRFDKLVGKTLPGTYINFESGRETAVVAAGTRGTVVIPLPKADYGPAKQFIRLTNASPDAAAATLGHSIYDSDNNRQMLLLREAFKRATTVYAYILSEGEKASGTGGGVIGVAKHGGSHGNDLTYTISENPLGGFDVDIHLSGDKVVTYEGLTSVDELIAQECPYIDFASAFTDDPAENAVKVKPMAASAKAYGKSAGDLQRDVTVVTDGNTAQFKGTLPWVTGYKEFNPGNPEEQSGNFIAIDLSDEGLTAEDTYDLTRNGQEYKKGIKGDDKTLVIRVTDPSIQFAIKTSKGHEVTFDISHITRISEAGESEYEPEPLVEIAGVNLTGGTDEEVSNKDITDFIDAWESVKFDTVAFPFDGADESQNVKQAALTKIKYMRESMGRGVQVVIPNAGKMDYEGVISVTNSISLDGDDLSVAEACAWVAGATAGASNTESLTYVPYAGATSVVNPKSNEEAVAAVNNGELFFTVNEDDEVVVMYDINTLITFADKKDKSYRKNRVIRVYDTFQQSVQANFPPNKFDNNERGWDIMEGIGKTILRQFEDAGAIRNVSYDEDFLVDREASVDDETYINVGLQAVDSAEKLYFTIKTR